MPVYNRRAKYFRVRLSGERHTMKKEPPVFKRRLLWSIMKLPPRYAVRDEQNEDTR